MLCVFISLSPFSPTSTHNYCRHHLTEPIPEPSVLVAFVDPICYQSSNFQLVCHEGPQMCHGSLEHSSSGFCGSLTPLLLLQTVAQEMEPRTWKSLLEDGSDIIRGEDHIKDYRGQCSMRRKLLKIATLEGCYRAPIQGFAPGPPGTWLRQWP